MSAIETEVVTSTVKDAVTTASLLNHVKNNRLEYLLVIGLMHFLGVSDRVYGTLSGVCF
jgi:hypothetical protein